MTIIAANNGSGSALGSLLLPLLLLVGLYFVLVRPQRRRAQAAAAQQRDLDLGSRVVTIGGIHGTVTAIHDTTVVLEVAPGVDLTFRRNAVAQVVPVEQADPLTEDGSPVDDRPELPADDRPPLPGQRDDDGAPGTA